MTSSSKQGDPRSRLSFSKKKKGHNKQSSSREIDWTKLMESAMNDELDLDVELGSSYHGSAVDMFLKSPTRKHSTSSSRGDGEDVGIKHSSHPRSSKDKKQSETPIAGSATKEKFRMRPISGDPNLHAVSDLFMRSTDSDDVSSSMTTSDPSQSERATCTDSKHSDISERVSQVTKLRNVSKLMSSLKVVTNSSHHDTKVHLGSRWNNDSVDQGSVPSSFTQSSVTHIVDNLSDTASTPEDESFKHNVFSLDQLESCDPSLLVNSRQFDNPGNPPSHSESLPGHAYQRNMHTVDELLSDGPSMLDKAKQTHEDVPRQLAKSDTGVSKDSAPDHAQTLTAPRNANRLIATTTSSRIQTYVSNFNSTKRGHHDRENSNVSEDEREVFEIESKSERYSYSSDDDFESQSITEIIADEGSGAETITDRDGSGAETVTDSSGAVVRSETKEDTLLNVSETVLSHSEQLPSYTTSRTETYSASVTEPHEKTSHRDISVQTSDFPYVTNSNHGPQSTSDYNPYVGSDYYVTPTSILSHLLPPVAVEVLGSDCPASIALNDMLRSQLALTRQSVEATKRLIANICDSTNGNYQYTTLEDTKAFIKQHRPKVLTLKEVHRRQSAK